MFQSLSSLTSASPGAEPEPGLIMIALAAIIEVRSTLKTLEEGAIYNFFIFFYECLKTSIISIRAIICKYRYI